MADGTEMTSKTTKIRVTPDGANAQKDIQNAIDTVAAEGGGTVEDHGGNI